MSFFGTDSQQFGDAIQPILSQPPDLSARERETQAGAFDNFGGALIDGISEVPEYSRLELANARLASATTPEQRETALADQKRIAEGIQALRPDPNTTGIAGQIVGSFLRDTLLFGSGMAASGGLPIGGIMDVTNQTGQVETELAKLRGVDQTTAEQMGRNIGSFAGAGMALPAAVRGGLLMRAGSGAAIGAGTAVAEQKTTAAVLAAAGYDEMARAYGELDMASLGAAALLGAAFGGVLGERGRRPLPSEVDAALSANRTRHIETETAPGTPADPQTRAAHLEAVQDSAERIAAGEPVRAEEIVRDGTFIDPEYAGLDTDAIVRQVLTDEGVPDVEARLREVTGEAQGRGIDTELLQLQRRNPQIDTPEFREFFGDSKVVDEAGQPLVVYKAMYPYDYRQETKDSPGPLIESINRPSKFPAFNKGEEGVDIAGFFGAKEVANRFAREGGYGSIFPVFLSFQRPFEIDAAGGKAGNFQFGESGAPFREAIRSGKYDSVIIRNTSDEGTIYVALKPEQIKSATGNRGTFDPKDPSILRAISNSIRRQTEEPAPAGEENIGPTGDVRGALKQAAEAGDITPEAGRLAEWLLAQNPDIVRDVQLLVRNPRDNLAAGAYSPAQRLITIFRRAGDDETAVHEVLHHSERLMPADVQDGIRKLWLSELDKQAGKYPEAVADVKAAAGGDKAAGERLIGQIERGELPFEFYQFTNASEYWAANAARLIRERSGADAEGWIAKAVQWLREFIQKAREAFGLDSKAALSRGLDAVLGSDGADEAGLLSDGPDPQAMTIPTDDGRIINAADAVEQAKRDAKSASDLAKTFTDAVECAMRFGT